MGMSLFYVACWIGWGLSDPGLGIGIGLGLCAPFVVRALAKAWIQPRQPFGVSTAATRTE